MKHTLFTFILLFIFNSQSIASCDFMTFSFDPISGEFTWNYNPNLDPNYEVNELCVEECERDNYYEHGNGEVDCEEECHNILSIDNYVLAFSSPFPGAHPFLFSSSWNERITKYGPETISNLGVTNYNIIGEGNTVANEWLNLWQTEWVCFKFLTQITYADGSTVVCEGSVCNQ